MRLRASLGLRLLFAFFVLNGLAAFFVLRIFTAELKPSAREVMEETLVDTANILAELAAQDFAQASADTPEHFNQGRFAQQVDRYVQRPVDAKIWGLRKQSLDYRIYVTDARGIVLYDSAHEVEGRDFSRWRDVYLTLRGQYGARSTPQTPDDPDSTVMHVAAPVVRDGQIIGVLTVAKPNSTVQQFVQRAEGKMLRSGLLLLALSAAVGVLVTLWMVWNVRKLRRYANSVQAGHKLAVPDVPGELGDLAQAMDAMRSRLEGREYIENYVRTLTHELKSPVAAIHGAAELLHENLPDADRQRFAGQIVQQTARIQQLVDRLLQLNRLEQQQGLEFRAPTSLRHCADRAVQAMRGSADLRPIHLQTDGDSSVLALDGELVVLACTNLLANAIDFAPPHSTVQITVAERSISVQDAGSGVPDYALHRLGERFFTTARPDGQRTGTGLGLAIVKQIMVLHGGRVRFANTQPGLRVTLEFGGDG